MNALAWTDASIHREHLRNNAACASTQTYLLPCTRRLCRCFQNEVNTTTQQYARWQRHRVPRCGDQAVMMK